MNDTTTAIKELVDTFLAENTKFDNGNAAAGTRARKALAELTRLAKTRRSEITVTKNERKAAKAE